MNIDIEDFYKNNKCNQFFDELNYQNLYPESSQFYQPYCKDSNISEKQRLYFHWVSFGLELGWLPCQEDIYHVAAFSIEEINNCYQHKDRLLKMFFNLIKSDDANPRTLDSDSKKDFDIKILKYIIDNVKLEDRIQEDAFDD
tara:strand:- start:446 stop:871 length:426 start_codon:yes stop_codon:yes gene_type:complete